jgi:hypothetical protein
MPCTEEHLLVDVLKKVDIQYPSHYKDTGIVPNSVAGEEGNRSGISP